MLTVDTDISAAATARALSPCEVAVVKFALCSGQYPRLAAPDRGNLYRNCTEQVFHTMNGQMALLHPSSSLQAVLAEQRAVGIATGAATATATAGPTSRAAPTGAADDGGAPLELTQNELLCYGKVPRPIDMA